MKAELVANFKAILSNPESPTKLLTDTLRTLRYSYLQSDPDVITLVALATANGVAEAATTDPYAAGLAAYEYCPISTLQSAYGPGWHAVQPGLAEHSD